jgi:hypothetical protein
LNIQVWYLKQLLKSFLVKEYDVIIGNPFVKLQTIAKHKKKESAKTELMDVLEAEVLI